MKADENEEKLLRSVALQNAQSILLARQRAERELTQAKGALEQNTKELAHSLAMMRATLESTTDGVLVTDERGTVTGFNQRFVEMWGLSREARGTWEHRQLLEITSRHFKDPEQFRARIEGIYASSPPESFDLLELSDGRVFERFSRIQSVHERNVGRVWSFRDITERVRAEEVRVRLAAIVESSDDAILSKTLEGIIITWNTGAERMFGYAPDEVIGKSVTVLIPPDRANEEPAILERLKKGERIEHYETVRVRKDGTLLDIALTVSPIKDASGRIIGASKIARDITERKWTEKALREAHAKLSRYAEDLEKQVTERTATLRETIGELEAFSYSISHDLRAPLRAMQGFALILGEECATQMSPEGKGYIRRITTAAERMDRLIQDVLNYSRVARAELPLERIDTEKLLRDILESYPMFHAPAADIQLEGTFPLVLGNQAVLTQCISNLLGNAVKFVASGVTPRVRVWAETVGDGKMVRLFFKDNGLGIDKEAQEMIFGIFQRVSQSYEGTGIGLAIVKKGVERMGGAVGLESGLAQGSTFWLELNRAKIDNE